MPPRKSRFGNTDTPKSQKSLSNSCGKSSSTESDVSRKSSAAQLVNLSQFKFSPFNFEEEEWRYYIQRFELEVSLQRLGQVETPIIKRNLLLKWVGATSYRLVVDHFSPESVMNVSYDEITSFLASHYQKPSHYLAERLQFSTCMRKNNQSIRNYLAHLRKMAIPCQFGKSLEERIRDQLVCGLQNAKIQQEIFRQFPADQPCTLTALEQFVLILENAEVHTKSLTTTVPVFNDNCTEAITSVNRLQSSYRGVQNQNRSKSAVVNLDVTKHCLRCGRDKHENKSQCRALEVTCTGCGKVGHYFRVCTTKGNAVVTGIQKKKPPTATNNITDTSDTEPEISNITIYSARSGKVKRLRVNVFINGIPLSMRYDPGADRTVVCSQTWRDIGSPLLTKIDDFVGYPQVKFPIRGEALVSVCLAGEERKLFIAVAMIERAENLFGFDWMEVFDLVPVDNRIQVCTINRELSEKHNEMDEKDRQVILSEFKTLFSGDGRVQNFQAHFKVNPEGKPVIARARMVPFAWKKSVDDELDRLVDADIMEPVDTTTENIEWASAIVIQVRNNGKIRLCGDFKSTVNPHILFENYHLPTFEEAISKLASFTEFSVIDLKDAFHQLEVHPDCRKYLIISTHRGYFRFKTLPMGITMAPLIFQKFMDTILKDLDGVTWYQDDIALGGVTRADHLVRLRSVLSRLQKIGLRTQPTKLKLLQKEIVYLGYRVNAQGIFPKEDKVAALKNLPEPKNIKQLQSFLGSINYYSRFLPSLQANCAPLHRLLHKNQRWNWTANDKRIFTNLKEELSSEKVIIHYQPELPLVLTVDASEYGLGALLQHRYSDGTLHLVSAASRTLSISEQKYAPIDREALAIMFGIAKFEIYLLGRHFILQTDHRPLTRIFGDKEELPKVASSRLTRWAIHLSNFNYTIEHIPGHKNNLADSLSRLPQVTQEISTYEETPPKLVHIHSLVLEQTVLTKHQISSKSAADPILKKVISYVHRGWPDSSSLPPEMQTFYTKREELQVEEGLLLWHDRIVIPNCLRNAVLHKLHETHPGASTMKNIAKTTIWWPNSNKDIENFSDHCTICQKLRQNEPATPLHLWNMPEKPWDRLHIDYTGPYEGKMWFVVIDAYSRWLEIVGLSTATTVGSIRVLRTLFARYGFPNTLVSDNASIFTSEIFKQFASANGIHLVTTTPYHSRSNSLVERAIRTFKSRYEKSADQFRDPEHRLQAMLFVYRNSVHSSTGRTPSEMFLGRIPRTFFQTLGPNRQAYADRKALKMKLNHDQGLKERSFSENQPIWYRRKQDPTWSPGTIQRRTGDLSYRALPTSASSTDACIRLHADQLRPRSFRNRHPPTYLQDYAT